MPLKFVGETCGIEVYGPDEDGIRIICTKVSGCPLNHPGEIGLDCLLNKENHPELIGLGYFGAGSAVPEAGVQPPGPPESAGSRPEASERSPLPQNRTTPGTPEVEPGAGKTEMATVQEGLNVAYVGGKPGPVPDSHIKSFSGPHLNKIISHEVHDPSTVGNASGSEKTFSENLSPPDSHMVVDRDARREEMVQKYVDKLNEISFEMYLESKSSGPPPIPILGPRESEEFLKELDEFKLTPEQIEFYRDARRRFPPEQTRRKLLKHRRRYAPRRTAGMIRMNNEDGEEESQFAVDVPSVKPQTELEKPVPKVERPEEPEEPEEDENEDVDEAPEQVIEGFETSGDTSLGGYFLGLEVWTDADGDHTVTLTIDAMSYDIMLPDFMEMLGALNKVKGRLQQILNT